MALDDYLNIDERFVSLKADENCSYNFDCFLDKEA
jgi:hypothetical protein